MANSGRSSWGAGVRELRGIKGWSQIELAEAAGVTQPTISRIEGGSRRISDTYRVRIAQALEVEPHELFPYLADEQAS